MSKLYVFYIRGMTCVGCSNSIESYLKTSDLGVQSFNVDVTTSDPKKATVTLSDDNREHKQVWHQIKERIEDIGFTCEPYEDPLNEQQPSPPLSTFEQITLTAKNILTSHWFLGALGCITGLSLMFVLLTTGVLPLAAMIVLGSLSSALTLALGARSYYDAWIKWSKAGALTMDTLFAISTLSVIAVSIASFFIPWLPMMFEVGLLIYGFKHIGVAIQDTIKEKISSAKFQDRAPKAARIVLDNTIKIKKLDHVQPDDIILVNPGEIIPLDGSCEEECRIYNTIISGAILPRRYRLGEKVLAGMRLAENATPLKIRVSKTRDQSYLAHLDTGIAKSILEKAPIELKTNQYLTYFIPTVIGIALISGIIIGIFFPPALAIQCALSVLVSACPCTLGLITPLAVITGMNKAAEKGVQFKNSTLLEQAEQIDVVVLDLHGTVTKGIPAVDHFKVLEHAKLSADDFLNLASALEKKSTHPIGKAIYSFAKPKRSQIFAVKPDDSHHAGRLGKINDQKYLIGSKTLMQKEGISTTSLEQELHLGAGDNVVFFARENTLIGYFIITDPLRDDAIPTIQALTEMGIEIHLCTGADEETANRYAKVLGITTVHAGCVATSLEEGDKSKPAYIESLKKKGLKVAMVGDAANDAQAIVASNFGIAIVSQNSDEKTQQEAGAIVHSGTLLPLASAFAISKQTVTNIKQNLLMSLGYNLTAVLIAGGLLVAIGLTLNPGVGVALMAVQACIILLNVYRFKHQSLPHLKKENSLTEEAIYEPSSHIKINKQMPKNQNSPVSDLNASSSQEEKISEKAYLFWKSPYPNIPEVSPTQSRLLIAD